MTRRVEHQRKSEWSLKPTASGDEIPRPPIYWIKGGQGAEKSRSQGWPSNNNPSESPTHPIRFKKVDCSTNQLPEFETFSQAFSFSRARDQRAPRADFHKANINALFDAFGKPHPCQDSCLCPEPRFL